MNSNEQQSRQALAALKIHLKQRIQSGESHTLELEPSRQSQTKTTAAAEATQTDTLVSFNKAICECQKCALGKTRTKFVFGEGSEKAKLVFVGEAPGGDEDQQGRPFVGEAGKLLTKIIEAMGMKREDVYICNVLKCRPPQNRDPQPEEIEQCEPYLIRQLSLIKPAVICALGKHAAHTLLKSQKPISQLRGQVFAYQDIPVVPTYHPAACLYNPEYKKDVWVDMKKIMEILKVKV